jgi:sporulation protein YlmC with PRC-barrel domain
MNKKNIVTLAAIATLSTLTPRVNAADAKVETHVDLPDSSDKADKSSELKVETDTSRDRTRDSLRDSTKIRHSDKASGIIGMEVRNAESQKLGEIKDLVLDVNSGKVSYAVLAVGGFLGIGEKLIALPPTSLKQATDGEYLILRADKSKIMAAPGFAATAWPSKNDHDINQFWNDVKATGAPGSIESNRRQGDVDVDVDVDKKRHSIQGEVNKDSGKIYTDADKDKKVKIDIDKD